MLSILAPASPTFLPPTTRCSYHAQWILTNIVPNRSLRFSGWLECHKIPKLIFYKQIYKMKRIKNWIKKNL